VIGISLGALRLVLMSLVPLLAQIFPGWIDRNDESNFLDAQPALDTLLAFDGVVNVFESLEINKPVEFVFCGEFRAGSCLVFTDPPREIVGDAYVQSPRTVRHDVDKIHRSFAWWFPAALELPGLRMTNLGTHVSDG
jgi:hypothetical protein